MSLLGLPNEILLLIAFPLRPRDLANLLFTNRRLSILLLPQLHKLALDRKDTLPALHWAVLRNYKPLIKLILTTRPELIDQKDNDGWTALHYAAVQGRTDTVKTLLEHGADTTQRNNIGESALEVTPEFASDSRFGLLLQFPAHKPGGDKWQVKRWHQWQGAVQYETITRLLIEHGANINNQDHFGRTPLHWATRSSLPRIVKILLEAGADPDVQTRDGDTPLLWAVELVIYDEKKKIEIINLLLDSGADATIRNGVGEPLLHFAVSKVSIEATRLLLEKGNVDPNEVDQYGHSAFLKAGFTAKKIHNRKPEKYGCILELFSLLLEHGVEIDVIDSNHDTVLLIAALLCREDLIKLLLEKGADPRRRNRQDCTAIDVVLRQETGDKASKERIIALLKSAEKTVI